MSFYAWHLARHRHTQVDMLPAAQLRKEGVPQKLRQCERLVVHRGDKHASLRMFVCVDNVACACSVHHHTESFSSCHDVMARCQQWCGKDACPRCRLHHEAGAQGFLVCGHTGVEDASWHTSQHLLQHLLDHTAIIHAAGVPCAYA